MIDMVTSHNGFTSDIELFTDENINNIKKSLFRLMIISSEPNAKPISKKEVSFDVYYNDKSGKKYDFIWDNKKFHKNYKKHAILFNEVFNFISNIDIYGIGLKLDQKHNTDDEIRWAYYLYTMPKNTSNADRIGAFIRITYTMRWTSIYNNNKNHILTMRFISIRKDSHMKIKELFPDWWKNNIINTGTEKMFKNTNENDKIGLKCDNDKTSVRFYTRSIDIYTKEEKEEWLSLNDLLTDECIMVMQENNLQTVEELSDYYAERVDWCKLYGFDEEIDSYSDFSNECANRIKLFNLKNSVAFNRSVMKVRDAGIHLPDVRLSYECWPDYARLRNLIETGGDQKEILRLFPIVFAEYVVMPGDVDTTDPDIERYTTIAGVPKHVYLDSSLPMNAYTKDNPWNIEIGKQWLKDRQMALLENKDR